MIILALNVSSVSLYGQVVGAKILPKQPVLTQSDASCQNTFDDNLIKKNVSPENIFLYRLINIHATEHIKKLSFQSFINDFVIDELKKNIWAFPILNIDKIRDPKTNALPKILIPSNINRGNATFREEVQTEILPSLKVDEFNFQRVVDKVEPNSIIWLPNAYIIAGSFHKEMYPHDTSSVIWTVLELAKSDKLDQKKNYLKIMKDQLENFYFQVKNFGYVLNGNRGYFLTRSQTNNIPSNVLQYYLVSKDKKWLKNIGLPLAESTYNYWTNAIAKETTPNGFGYKWVQHGKGPCLEVALSHEAHNYYYYKVLEELVNLSKLPDEKRPIYAKGFDYKKVVEEIPENLVYKYLSNGKLKNMELFHSNVNRKTYLLDRKESDYDIDEPILKIGDAFYKLTNYYYRNDRLSRVSGYDTNHLYGPFNSFASDFLPADHNLMLYKHSKDISKIYEVLGDKLKAVEYEMQANELKNIILKDFWDEETGMFYDYNLASNSLRRDYPFLSSAYAIWAGIFDVSKVDERIKLIRLVNFLKDNFEGHLGLYPSTIETGLHWDKPYVWPVQQQYIIGGLREYAHQFQARGELKLANYLTHFADGISVKYLLANYADWLASKGTSIGEKVLLREENLLTGYASGNNYSWNLSCVNYLYQTLSDRTKKAFDKLID